MLTLLEASRPSPLIPVLFVISRGPWAGKADYFADVQVFFVGTKPLPSVCCPNMCCLWGQQRGAQAVGFRLRALRPGSGSRGLPRMLNQLRVVSAVCLCVRVQGHTGLFLQSPLRWDWGGWANSAPLEGNQQRAACSLHSSAITALCSALLEQRPHSFWPFPRGWGELIRQRNHYGFKSHTPHRK